MNGLGGNYWTLDGFTNNGKPNVIGVFDARDENQMWTFFWH